MEHPTVDVSEIKANFTLEQLQEKISQLRSRLNFAYGTGQQDLIHQLSMVLECYDRAQTEKLNEMFSSDEDDDDIGDNIRIT